MARITILGAGVAGLSAARALSPFHDVTVLEESEVLGGVGDTLSCKSGVECGVCSACTLPELVEEVLTDDAIDVRTRSSVEGISRAKGGGWTLSLGGDAVKLKADALILATGLEVTDGTDLSEFGMGRFEGVATALDLDRSLRGSGEGGDVAISEGDSVAIIQCVCSRDTGELPYCSRVCCAYSARLALEIRDRHPDTSVTVFYMDLQRADAVAARQIDAAMATEGVGYVRSRPSMVQPVPEGGLEVLYEDTISGEIVSSVFDRVVLSTGLVPSQGTRRMAELLGLDTDAYGFVAPGNGGPATTSVAGVLAAGGATGPVDLVEAAMGGLAAAAAVLEAHPPVWKLYPPRIILVGDEAELEEADRMASAAGASTATIVGGPGRGLHRLEGMVLAFKALMGVRGGGRTVALKGDMVVIAPRRSLVTPVGPRDALGFPELEAELSEGGTAGKGRYALVMGDDPEAIVLAKTVLDADPEAGVDVLYREMAVAEQGMQELQLDLASRGARFHRYSPGSLSTSPLDDGTFEVRFRDELCPELGELSLLVDRVAAPAGEEEAGLVWPWYLSRYAPEGIPSDLRLNVLPILTPRRGVYTTVPGTRTASASRLGAAAAVAAAMSDYARGFAIFDEVAEVDPDLCAACLNCLRVCPHDAIVFDGEERAACVLDLACQDCGLCAAICPAKAINMVTGITSGGEG